MERDRLIRGSVKMITVILNAKEAALQQQDGAK